MFTQPGVQGIYAITPDQSTDWPWSSIFQCSHAALDGGVRVLQMRQKGLALNEFKDKAQALAALCERYAATFILNDPPAEPSLATWSGVAGVHLGKNDLSVAQARILWGDRLLVGASCYNQLDLAKQAVEAGASYVAFGALFSSQTKPGAVSAPLSLFNLFAPFNVPSVGIGGVQQHHLPQLVHAGAQSAAIISGLFGDAPSPVKTQSRAAQWVLAWDNAQKEFGNIQQIGESQ